MLWNSTVAPTQPELLSVYRAELFRRIDEGSVKPAVLPHDLFGLFLLYGYLLIDHRKRPWLYSARWLVMAMILAFEVHVLSITTSRSASAGFGSGLVATFTIIWSMNWLIFKNPQVEAKRVERRRKRATGDSSSSLKSPQNGNANGHKITGDEQGLRQRRQNGHVSEVSQEVTPEPKITDEWEYFWQPYPEDSIWTRLDWTFDLIMNLRGPGWNWEISTLPEMPDIKAALGEKLINEENPLYSSTGCQGFKTRTDLFWYRLPRYIIFYTLLDIFKIMVKSDPYFILGPNDYPLPTHLTYLPPTLVPTARQLISLISIIVALRTIFSIPAWLFCLLLGPRFLGLRGEAAYYPSTWGSFTTVMNRGLAGFWGGWWHQSFRAAFEAPTQYLIKRKLLKPNTKLTLISYVFFAFMLSGMLHAGGSLTSIPPTKPLDPPFFFGLQIFGVLFQTLFCEYFKSFLDTWFSKRVRQAGNVVFTFAWLWVTSPLLLDDFAREGIWTFEPIPVSFLTWLGFGNKDGRVLAWGADPGVRQGLFWWYDGGGRVRNGVFGAGWWECGLAF